MKGDKTAVIVLTVAGMVLFIADYFMWLIGVFSFLGALGLFGGSGVLFITAGVLYYETDISPRKSKPESAEELETKITACRAQLEELEKSLEQTKAGEAK